MRYKGKLESEEFGFVTVCNNIRNHQSKISISQKGTESKQKQSKKYLQFIEKPKLKENI